ncbi:MAG: hypothetical protein Q9215_007468 [Flavoplaca cf. flavocitrina]
MVAVFGNATANGTTSWTSEPNGRGTWSLLSTCIITVSLCVWSAVHLNVRQHQKVGSQYWRKTKWLLLGIFAPEVLAYVAWQQRQDASALCRAVRAVYQQEEIPGCLEKISQSARSFFRTHITPAESKPKLPDLESIPVAGPNSIPDCEWDRALSRIRPPTQRARWELAHGFYASMGGFAVAHSMELASIAAADAGSDDRPLQSFLPENVSRATLTPDGLRFLMFYEPSAVPSITIEQIMDKSKADGLKKTLVCAQALWFCLQCLTRLSQSLPISLLELNTFGHALCTLAIYIFWWHKPLDIEEPTILEDPKYYPIFSYMWMSSSASVRGHCDYDMPDGLQSEFHCFWPFEIPRLGDLRLTDFHMAYPKICQLDTWMRAEETIPDRGLSEDWTEHFAYERQLRNENAEKASKTRRRPYLSLSYKIKCRLRSIFCPDRLMYGRPAGLGIRKTAISCVSKADVGRWAHALHAIMHYPFFEDINRRHGIATSGRFFSRTLGMRVPFLDSIQNNGLNPLLELRARNAVPSLAPSGILPGFAITGALYGGLHLVAWSAPLSSPLEKVLWQIAGASVTCTGFMFGLLTVVAKTNFCKRSLTDFVKIVTRKPLDASTRAEKVRKHAGAIGMGLLSCVVLSCLPVLWFLYLASRGYLVVESLKNVAYLPPGSFKTPEWPSYFPHIA